MLEYLEILDEHEGGLLGQSVVLHEHHLLENVQQVRLGKLEDSERGLDLLTELRVDLRMLDRQGVLDASEYTNVDFWTRIVEIKATLAFLVLHFFVKSRLEARDDVLLMNKLDLFKEDRQTNQRQPVHVLEEDPHRRHRAAIEKLGQRRKITMLAALDGLERHCTERGKLLDDLLSLLMLRNALKEH